MNKEQGILEMDIETLIKSQTCPVCKRKLISSIDKDNWMFSFNCPMCGEFEVTQTLLEDDFKMTDGLFDLNHLSIYLCYTQSTKANRVLGISESKNTNPKKEERHFISPRVVENWYPRTFSEKIDLIIDYFGRKSDYVGYPINCKLVDLITPFFIEKEENVAKQLYFFFDYLLSEVLIKEPPKESKIRNQLWSISNDNSLTEFHLQNETIQFYLTSNAWKRIYSNQKSEDKNKNVFVSMAFNYQTKKAREAIREGIINAGFSPEYIDEIIHNKQIVPEMFRLIRECRFLILDITEPNYGAYYEAGYALGLGKEVIICCSYKKFNKEYKTKEEKKFAKYLRPHFDILQKQILVWKDEEDLTKRLTEWIRALIK